MKKIILLILITSFCFSCAVQKPRGLYYDEKSGCMACVHNDSIAIVYKRSEWDGPCYFYGTFNRTQDTIVLNENLLRHKNAIVETLYTDYPGIEIQLYELYPDIPLGAPTDHFDTFYQLTKDCRVWWIYQLDSKGNLFWSSQPDIKTIDGIIQIPIEAVSDSYPIDKELLVKGYVFFTEQILEIKPHTRYVIKQKNYNQNNRPMIPQEVPIVYNPKNNQIEITESSSINYQPYRTFQLKHIGMGKSCLGELRKRYPDL